MAAELPVSDVVVNEIYPVALDQARWRAIGECLLVPFFGAFLTVFAIFRGFSDSLVPLAFVLLGGVGATIRDVRWWLWLRNADPREAYARLQADGVGLPFKADDAYMRMVYLPVVFTGFTIYEFSRDDRLSALTIALLGLLLWVRAPRTERAIAPGRSRRTAAVVALMSSVALLFAASALMMPLWWGSLAILTGALLVWHTPDSPAPTE